MRLFKKYGIMTTIASIILLGACTPEENPCPSVEISVEIDSANLEATVKLEGVEDLNC